MRRQRFAMLAAAVGLVTAPMAGCLERKESITITKDGRVTIAVAYEGEKGDFETLDAMPSQAAGWKVEREIKQDGDKEVIKITGERSFGPNEELPSSFASPSDPNRRLYLSFPTTVRREVRSDGVYLHFRRVYEPRDWAYVQLWVDNVMDDNIKQLGEKKPEELTHEERVQVVRAIAGAEGLKQVELAQRALRESNEALKPDHWLLARRALLDVYEEHTDWDRIAHTLASIPEEQRQDAMERESQQIIDAAHRAFVTSLRNDAKYDPEHFTRFEAAYDRAKKYYDITNQTGGHAFDIEVTMPGEIVAHNADKTEGDNTVRWQFDGTAFRDRSFELMVTSRLPLDRKDD